MKNEFRVTENRDVTKIILIQEKKQPFSDYHGTCSETNVEYEENNALQVGLKSVNLKIFA